MARRTLKDFLDLPSEERKKIKFSQHKRSYVKRQFTREEIITYLTKNKLDSTRKLIKFRKDDEPNVYDCQKIFGSWSAAKEAAFGIDILNNEPECDAEYLVKLVVRYELWTWRKYTLARKAKPSVVPSINQVKNHWNSFADLKRFSKAYSMKHMVAGFLSLKRKLGRMPNKKDCEDAGVNLERLLDKLGGKRELDQLIREVEFVYHAIKK
jgi:hypothetical protein